MKKTCIMFFLLVLHLESISQKFGLKPMDSIWTNNLYNNLLSLNEYEYQLNYRYYDSTIDKLVLELEPLIIAQRSFDINVLSKTYHYDNFEQGIEMALLTSKNEAKEIHLWNWKLNSIADSIANFQFIDNDSNSINNYYELTKRYNAKANELSQYSKFLALLKLRSIDINTKHAKIYSPERHFKYVNEDKQWYLKSWYSYLYYEINNIESAKERIDAFIECCRFYREYEMNYEALSLLTSAVLYLNKIKDENLKLKVAREIIDFSEDYRDIQMHNSQLLNSLQIKNLINKLNLFQQMKYVSYYSYSKIYSRVEKDYLLYIKYFIYQNCKLGKRHYDVATSDFLINAYNRNENRNTTPYLGEVFYNNRLVQRFIDKNTYNSSHRNLEELCLFHIKKNNWEKASYILKNYVENNRKIGSLGFLLFHTIEKLATTDSKSEINNSSVFINTIEKIINDPTIEKINLGLLRNKFYWLKFRFFSNRSNQFELNDSTYKYGYWGYWSNDQIRNGENWETPINNLWVNMKEDNLNENINSLTLQTKSLRNEYDELKSDYGLTISKNEQLIKVNSALLLRNDTLKFKYIGDSTVLGNRLKTKDKELKAKDVELNVKSVLLNRRTRNFGIAIGTLIGIIFSVVYFYKRRLEKKEIKNTELELKAINSSLNPHFIKGTINTLETTVKENTQKENETYFKCFNTLVTDAYKHSEIEGLVTIKSEIILIKKLIAFYNCTIEHKNNKIIPPTEEVGDEINKNVRIPKMLLFNYVENSVTKAFNDFRIREKKISIIPKFEGAEISIDIIDTGGGFPIEILGEGHNGGVQKTQAIIDNFNAQNYSYTIESKIDSTAEGTHVKLTFRKK